MVFLVDASKEMFIKGEDGEPSNFDITMQVKQQLVFNRAHTERKVTQMCLIITVCDLSMQVVRSVYTSKIISSYRDLVALVFYGTEQSKNPRNSFKHVYVYHDLDEPGES